MHRRLTYLFIIVILLAACSSPATASHEQPSLVSSDTPLTIFSPTPAPTGTHVPTRDSTATFNPTLTATSDLHNPGVPNFDQFVQIQTYGQTLEKAVGVSLSEIRVDALAYSPDGRYLAVGGCNGYWSGNCISDIYGGQSFLLILDARTAEVVSALPETKVTVTSLAFSSDGEKLVYATNSDRIVLWDVASGKIEKVLWQAKGSANRRLAISPDGNMVADVDSTHLQVRDVISGTVLTQKPGGNPGDKLPRFSADGSRLAAFSSDSGLEITIYNTADWQPISTISLPGNPPGPLALSPDFKLVATAEGTGKVDVLLWDGETGQQLAALQDPLWNGIDAVGFTADGQRLLVSGTPSAEAPYHHPFSVWDVTTHQNLGRMIGPDDTYRKIIFSNDGTAFTTGGTLWSLPDETVLAARAAVTDFLTALNKGNYDTAAADYKPYEGESDYFNSVGVDLTDIPALLRYVCGLDSQPCMPIKEILYAGKEALGDYGVLVSFTAPDGSVYKDADGFDSFWFYGDMNADGKFIFDTLPPFPR